MCGAVQGGVDSCAWNTPPRVNSKTLDKTTSGTSFWRAVPGPWARGSPVARSERLPKMSVRRVHLLAWLVLPTGGARHRQGQIDGQKNIF